ncbi:hypothetical protein EON68_03375 [archaeon]|nr:MAG: hypothetical protein EON68_03375 [archaeon]
MSGPHTHAMGLTQSASGVALSPEARAAVLEGDASLRGLAASVAKRGRRNFIVLLGAGASVSSGIPDFRTPGSGLYDILAAAGMRRPEDIFSLQSLTANPRPFYALAKKIWPSAHRPSKAHYFCALLERHGVLRRVYTQNIDMLERLAGACVCVCACARHLPTPCALPSSVCARPRVHVCRRVTGEGGGGARLICECNVPHVHEALLVRVVARAGAGAAPAGGNGWRARAHV